MNQDQFVKMYAPLVEQPKHASFEFCFPYVNMVVYATSLEDAKQKLQALGVDLSKKHQ